MTTTDQQGPTITWALSCSFDQIELRPAKPQVVIMKKSVLIIASLLLCFTTLYSQSNLQISQLGLSQVEEKAFSEEIHQARCDKNEFVRLVSFGQALCLSHRYVESNEYFEKAYQLRQDQHVRCMKSKYESYEDIHELFMILYFKAINYLEMDDSENAMVEGKRIVELMIPHNRYDIDRRFIAMDPLAQSLIGLLFSLNRECDDAAIAYKTAKDLFEKEYHGLCSKTIPQLVIDNSNEMYNSCDLRSIGHEKVLNSAGHLIFIWHNGEYPSIHLLEDFKIKRDNESFVSNDVGVTIREDAFGNYWLPFIEYKEPIFSSGELLCNGEQWRCETLSFASWFSMRVDNIRLEQRGAHLWRHNVHWTTLPGQICWAIVPLAPDDNRFQFKLGSKKEFPDVNFNVRADNKTHVYMVTTLENKTMHVPSNLKVVDYDW